MTTEVVVVTTTNTVVTENTETNVVEVTASGTTPTVEITAEGPAGPPGGSLTIQDQGVSEGLLTDKLNFAGSTVSVVNDTVNEIATVTINAATPGANANITSMTGITGGISSPDFIQFDTAAAATGAVGRMLWNDTDGTLEFQMKGGNVTLQVGQEQVLRVTNQSGSTMVDGNVVYITGSTGNHLNVTLSQANAEMTSSKTLAVITETIANNQSGFATTSGLVRNFNTSALTEGEAIWLSPTVAGGLTSTKPVAPDHAVLVGWCVRQHASVGVIYVHIANGYELQELHNVLITAVANNQVLRYDSATSLWKNVTISPTVTLTGAVTGSGTMTDLGSVSIATTATADPTLTLSGDATGTATFTNLGDATLSVTVVDDSHNHIISNVDGLQDALDLKAPLASPTFTGTVTLPSATSVGTVSATEIGYLDGVTSGVQAQLDSKLASSSYTAADVLTKIKTVDGVGSGLDADLLDGESGAYYLDFTNATNKPDPTITLSGDATGSVTLTDLASGTLSVTVVDDSHNHIISNVDGLQDALDAKLASADYTAADVLTKIKTVDGAGSGLDADLLDGQSSAYYTAINDRLGYTAENAANKGVANGYASLDGAGLVPSTQLPSYVDDVLEYANLAAFPATGVSGVIYVAIDTSKTYRWTGSVYVEISASPGTTDALTEGSVNLYFTQARARQSISAGTGISYNNSTGVVTNSAPDQTVALTAGTGISTSGTYPNFTITNSAPDQTVALSAGTGISTSGTYPNFTITNSAPDQTVALTGSGTTSISGTYPNFTISSSDQYVGTVTSVAALTLGTTGTDLSSSVANGTTTPVITLNVPTASASNRGALSSTDWSTFNGKQAALVSGTNIKTVNGTTLLGSGDLGTIGVAYGGTGATTFTNNALLKGAGTSALSSSVMYENGGYVGINVSGPVYLLDAQETLNGSGGLSYVNLSTGASSAASITAEAGGSYFYHKVTRATGIVQFRGITATTLNQDFNTQVFRSTGGTEYMRIDSSGNVGIGTSSPGFKLETIGGIAATTGSNQVVLTTDGSIEITRSTGDAYIDLKNTTGEDFDCRIQSLGTTTPALAFSVNGSERMRITDAGNVGIGTTGPGALLQLNKASGAADLRFSVAGTLYGNMYASSSDMDIFAVTAIPLILGTNNTERMRITSAGDVGIGTSSPSSRLTITGGITEIRDGNYLMLRPAGNGWDMRLQATGTQLDILSGGSLGSPIMSLLNGGNVGIGTSSPGSDRLNVATGAGADCLVSARAGNAAYFSMYGTSFPNYNAVRSYDGSGNLYWAIGGNGSANTMVMFTNGSERMRIDSSGNVGIGTSSPSGKVHVETTGTGDVIFIAANTGGTAGQSVYVIPVRTAGTLRGGIQWNGTNLLYNNSSDRRLKSNIADADDAASLIDAIQVRKFDWNESGNHQRYGFVAQELIEVAPEAVHQPKDEDEMMGVDYSKLVPMLVKELQSLRARVAELEGK